MLKWTWISLVVVVLDQLTKWMASSQLEMFNSVPVMPLFNLTLMHNTGAAFSFLSDAGGWQRWFFTVLAVGVSVLIVVWLRRLPPADKSTAAALALILGGAVGNVIDRVRFGYVVDFLDVYVGTAHWPAFNIADSAITVGAVILVLVSLRGGQKPAQDAQKPS